jgi:L-lactate dehydrogenase complex protein LldF
MKIRSHLFSSLSEKALSDVRLQENLERIGKAFRGLRETGFSRLEDPEALRAHGKAIRERALAHLPQLLETLEAKVQEAGGVVHWASTSKEAQGIVIDLAKKHKVHSVVKGKSMVTEEIGLNDALTDHGIEVWETDLGELIIQLAEEPPSHLVGPALHKSKEEIADLFAQKLNAPRTVIPEELTMIARQHLRERFLRSEMGITGVNMAVAETGSIVLVENEGNIRMSTTLPRVHVAIMGIEKVVPTLEDLVVLLSLLARSTTGQILSVYTSIFTGPRREGEMDGPEEFHLIILDNGRSRILADPDRRETLYCIRCGACLNVCPVYLKAGGHSYGWVYSGPIGAVLTPQLLPPRLARTLPFASTLCGACKEVCPVKIDLPRLLMTLRWRMVEDPAWHAGISLPQRLGMSIFGWVAARPGVYAAATRGARLLEPILAPSGRLTLLPPPFSRWATQREVPMRGKAFSQRWAHIEKEIQQAGHGV